MRSADREKALKLRLKYQLGYGTIAKRLSIPKSTLSYWLKDSPLSAERVLELRREAWGRGEASRELFRQTMRKKRELRDEQVYRGQKKKLGVLSRQSLFVAGLMLYLAEGGKKDRYVVAISNTDAWVIQFFIFWMEMFLKVPKSKMRVQLHLYESMNLRNEKKYWIRQLGLPESQFYKSSIRSLRPGSFSYPESFRHGTCKLQ